MNTPTFTFDPRLAKAADRLVRDLRSAAVVDWERLDIYRRLVDSSDAHGRTSLTHREAAYREAAGHLTPAADPAEVSEGALAYMLARS